MNLMSKSWTFPAAKACSPRNGFIATPLFGSGPKLAVAAVTATSVVFLFGSGQRIETSVIANTADEGGARRQISQHRSVGECGIGADEQRASSAACELIDGLPQMSEAFGSTAADGGRSRERTPALPLLGIGAARGFARRRGVLQINRNGTGRTRGRGGMLGQGQGNLQEATSPDEIIGKMRSQRIAPPRGAGDTVAALAN